MAFILKEIKKFKPITMKQFIFAFTLLAAVLFAQAQAPLAAACNPFPKTISVSGSAEMEIVPDEIYVQVDLHEYKKKGGDKVELDKIKTDFLALCAKVGIPDSTISIASYDGNNGNYLYWKKKKNDPSLIATITYQIKFKDSKTMDKLVEGLDDDATANFQITNVSHSKIEQYRAQLKIDAVKAARDKANNLTRAIQEHLGGAITIDEPEELNFANSYGISQFKNRMSNTVVATDESANTPAIDFKKIKLRFEVKVVFALM
jgi:uncharacterized protein YggE